MGNLHQGHIELVRKAKGLGDLTVASIFINRLQFLPHEDFEESDCAELATAGCDVLFAPDEKELYPEPQNFKVHPPAELANLLEGHFRPGFFVGDYTVVRRRDDLLVPTGHEPLVILGAARLAKTRLIDNLEV